jgi:hypothetical protein
MSSNRNNVSNNNSDDDNSDSNEDSDNSVDEYTSKIKELATSVDNYASLSNEDKVKNIGNYKELLSQVKTQEEDLAELKSKLISIEDLEFTNANSKKISNKKYNTAVNRFNIIKEIVTDDSSLYTLQELLDLFKELKQRSNTISNYLNEVDITYVD